MTGSLWATAPRNRPAAIRAAYRAERTPRVVDVPDLTFLVLPGRGDPALDPRPGGAAHSLRRVTAAVRFVLEQGPARLPHRPPPPLELVGHPLLAGPGLAGPRWSLLLRQPDEVDPAVLERALVRVGPELPAAHLDRLRLVTLGEGPAIQVLHLGPLDHVPVTLQRLRDHLTRLGLTPRGRPHLVLLRDRSSPTRPRRTVVRQPLRRADDDARSHDPPCSDAPAVLTLAGKPSARRETVTPSR